MGIWILVLAYADDETQILLFGEGSMNRAKLRIASCPSVCSFTPVMTSLL